MRDEGVTLLELVAFMAIAAGLASIAAFGFRDLGDRWLLGSAVRQVVLDLRMARVRSISETRSHRLRFRMASTHYQPEARDDRREYTATGAPRTLPDGVSVVECTGRSEAIGFHPRGNASSFGTITLRGRGGERVEVVVDMVGRVRVRP